MPSAAVGSDRARLAQPEEGIEDVLQLPHNRVDSLDLCWRRNVRYMPDDVEERMSLRVELQ